MERQPRKHTPTHTYTKTEERLWRWRGHYPEVSDWQLLQLFCLWVKIISPHRHPSKHTHTDRQIAASSCLGVFTNTWVEETLLTVEFSTRHTQIHIFRHRFHHHRKHYCSTTSPFGWPGYTSLTGGENGGSGPKWHERAYSLAVVIPQGQRVTGALWWRGKGCCESEDLGLIMWHWGKVRDFRKSSNLLTQMGFWLAGPSGEWFWGNQGNGSGGIIRWVGKKTKFSPLRSSCRGRCSSRLPQWSCSRPWRRHASNPDWDRPSSHLAARQPQPELELDPKPQHKSSGPRIHKYVSWFIDWSIEQPQSELLVQSGPGRRHSRPLWG